MMMTTIMMMITFLCRSIISFGFYYRSLVTTYAQKLFSSSVLLTILFIINISNVSSSRAILKCNNLFNDEYENLDDYADQMCSYCLDTMIVPGHEHDSPTWSNQTEVYGWQFDKDSNGYTGFIYSEQSDKEYRLRYRDLKDEIEKDLVSENFVLKQFSSKYYLVSIIIIIKIITNDCPPSYYIFYIYI